MTRDEFLARRRAAAEQQDEETTAQRPAVSSAASTGMTREEFLERRRAGMEAAEQQTSTSVSRPTSVSPDTDSTLRRLAAAKEQNRKTTRAELEETRTGSGRQLPGASGKLGDMLLDATRYQQAHKTGPSGEDALAYGIMSGTGAASLAALAGRALTGERADWYNDYQREAAEAAQAHPAAYGVGNVGGSLGIAYATGGLAGAATGALLTGEGAATAAGTVIKGLARNAMTFAMTDAIHNAGAFAADSMSDRDFINSMGVGMAQGAAGGLAAGLVSSGMANVLRKHNMMTPFMEFVRQTAAGTASAGANIATSYALRENKPTKEQMAQQFATAFLLSALQGAISTYETVQANKDQLEQYTAQMVKTWQQMAAQGQAAGMDRTQAGQQAFADQIRDLSTQIRFTLGRTYMAGQQQYVDNLYSLLDTLDDMIDTSMAQNAEWVYDTPVSPYNDAMLGSGEDIVPQLTEAITTGMTEGANQPPTPPVTPEAPVDTTIAAAGAQTPAPPEVSPATEEALRALTEQPDVPAAPETPQEPEIETPEEVIPREPEAPPAPEPEPEPEPAAEPETVSPAETLRQNAEAGGLGKKGQQAIGDFYSGGMDPEQLTQYYAGFSAYYKAGGDGVPAERVRSPFADALSEQAKIGAWSSGRADALAEGRTIPEPEPMPAVPETAVAQTPEMDYTGLINNMRSSLLNSGRFRSNGFEYSVDKVGSRFESYRATIRDTRNDVLGGAVSSARSIKWSTTFKTREEAADTMIEVARNNKLLGMEPETAVAQTEPSGHNEITEQPKPEAVQPEPMTTAETAKPTVEQAKEDLKRAIQVPVQTGNMEALRAAIKSGELSPDVVTLGSKVPGFTREQQESLARQIIEGQQDGKEVIHADVPGDGKFDIDTLNEDAVPKVLNALHVKVNQEAVITKDIDSWLKRSGKSGRSYVGRADDQYFLSDGYAAVRVPKTTADYALKEPAYKARMEDIRAQMNAAQVVSGTLEEPRRGKMTVRGQATQVYAFRTADGVLAFDKDAFNKIDGGTLSYGPMGRGIIAVSRGEDGEVRAFALAIDPKTFRQEDYNGLAPVKIKATLAAADTSTDNSLPAAGAQGAAEPAETMEQAPEEKPEKEEPRAAEPDTTPKQPHELLADEVEKALQSGKTLTGRDLTAMADKAFGGTRGENAYDIKTAYDAMELGVNKYLMKADFVREGNGDAASAVKTEQRLQALMAQLPTQTVRTEEQQQYQQFSTPPNIAYLAAWAANINDKDVVLEPSAGIGGLALWGKAWGATVYGNELSERRANILRSLGLDEVFTENAEQINNVLPDRVQPTVVVMNPPFSATAGRLSANNTANAKRHIEQALDRLNDGGRLVAILGNGMADDSRAFKTWWNDLRKEYDIRANLSINGENYRKYGTTFDVQMVVIDKTGPQQGETLRGEVKDLTKVPEMLEGIRNDRTRAEGRAAESERSGTERVSEPQPAGRERGGAAGRTGRSTGGRSRAGAVAAVADDEIGGRSEQERADEAVREADDGAGREELGESGGETAAADAGESADERIAEPEPERTLPKLKKKQKEPEPRGDESVYAEYVPPPTKIKGAKKHPAKLVESAAMSAVSIPPADYVPNLPKELITSGALSDAQLSNIVYAGQAHSQMIPQQGKRKGYFIGDGTGVGKGRQISGIILDNFRQGRTKALWISKGQNLFGDAQRDWADIGGKKEDVFSLSKTKADEKVKAPKGIMFTTYDTLANKSKTTKKTRLDQIVEWLGPDFDGVIAFDEAHTMGNLLGKGGGKFGRGAGPAQRAIAGAELQKRLPKARVVYVSATMATDVNEMAFADRLGLWGPGTQFNDVNDFVNKISSGGIAAMELVARDMKALGVYQARSISYDGVEYETLTHPLTPMQKEIYDTMSRAWQVTLQNMEKALNLTGANMNAQARAAAKSAYYGSMQRFYNQIVTSMAVPTVIKDIRKELAAGRSVVLQVVNTNEAQTNRKLAEAKEKGTELDELDITPREQLIGFLENSFPVQAFEEYEDENGNKRSRPVLDSNGKPVLDKKAVAMRDGMIAQIKEMRVPEGPLEMIFDAFGVEEVAEVTGRKRRVVPGKDAKGNTVKVEEKRSATSNEADVQAFQDGKKRILIFSDAGGTGKSYHADLRAKNQQQRVHYLLQPGWSAPKAVQGFGRTHRSNEASAPIYKLVTTDVRGQKRFVSTIARRLDQLGALTKGQRQTGSGMFSAKDNLESDLARDSLYNFYDALGRNRISGLDGRTVFRKLGLEDKFYSEGWFTLNSEVARDMSLFLNRILALEFDEQNEVFDAFSRTFDNAYDQALKNGTLDMGMETVRADKIEIIDDMTVREDPETGAKTQYVQAKLYEKPRIIRTLDDLAYFRSGFQGLVRKKNGDVAGVFRTIDKTEADGRVVKQFVLQSPMMGVMSHYVESTMEKETEPIPRKQWAKEWAAAVEKAPEYLESVRHMLTGTLLPVWNRLPDTGNVRVQRLIADDGRQYLGRVIPPAQIDGVLRQLGAKARTRETYTADDVIKQVFEKNGKKAVLYEERMEIVRRRVGGEWRLELLGDNLWFAERSYPGVYKEYINFKNRYFIPNGEAQKAVLEKILDQNGVRDIEDDRRSEDEYLLETEDDAPIGQEVSSAGTSIKQVPALFKDKNVVWGKVNIDIGGGRFDLATNFLKERGVFNLVFDPYNRPEKQNSDTLEFLQKGNKADTATCANVLNVIAESDARANVILEMAKAIKPDGRAYFMVYEGDGSGEGRKTSAGWQNNRKTVSYEDEIRQYFGEVVRKGKLIIATQPRRNLPKAAWEIQPGKAVRYSKAVGDGMMHPERWTAERVGDREKQAKSLSEIMEQIRHDFGINITKGHIRGRGVMGQYDDSNRGMRIRSANDLPTSVHELGHHLDNVYQFSENLTAAEKKELLDQLPEELKARYKEKEQPGEGVAEFVRRFMTNRTTAALDYPEFTKKFLNTMNGHDRALVEQLADEVNAALALDVDTATSSIRLREDGRPDARTIREKVNDRFHVAYQAFTDSLHGIKLFDEATGSSVYKLASNAAYVDNIAGQIVIGDLTDMNGQYVGPGLKTVLTGLDLKNNDTYMKFGEYLVVKHGPERLAEGMRIFADDRKNSEAFMNRRQQELEQEHPEFSEISDRLYEFQRQLLETWGVATGLLSQDQVDSWLKRWAYYVPFNRAVPVESRGLKGKRGFANQTSPFKKAVGSGLDIIHPVDSIVGHVAVLVNNGMKNNVARSLADAARNTPANAQLIEKIPTPMIPHKIGLKGVKQGIEDTAEMLLEKELIGDQAFLGIEAILHSMQDFMMQYTRQQPHGNIITVMRDGRPEYWKVNDPLLLRSLADMSPAKQEGFLAAYGMISRFMTTNITGMNVVWSIFSNAPRDLGTFFGYSKERNPLKVFPAIASAYANKANMSRGKDVDPLYKEYLAMGGGAMSMYSADSKLAQKARKQLAQTSISANPLEWISWMGDLIEQGPRYATYKLMRLRGMSPAEAFYEATDITVNFRRGGRLSRELNKLFPFFNAGVQGMDKFVRYFGAFDVPPGGPPKGPGLTGGDAGDGGDGQGGSGSGGSMPRDERSKVRRSRMMWYLIASAIAAAVSFAINHLTKDREEDYKRLSNWTKNNYFLVPIGDGRYFAISKPRELGVLSSFMESATERALMDDKHAMDDFYEYATDVMLPGGVAELAQGDIPGAVGSMGIFGVGAYLMANRDFLGRPIVSSGLTHLEARDQYNERTSKLGFWLGQAFNQSPQKIDFFFEQTLGGLWKYQKAVFPVASENRDLTLGVYNQYIKDSQYSTDLLNRMYDRTEASEKAKNSDPDDMDKAIWYKMDNNLSTFYGRFYKLSKEDSRSEQARAARKAVLEMINEYEITRESGQDPTPFESVWGEVFDAVRETGKTELLPKVLNPLIKSEKGYGTDLNAQQYLEYQTKYNDLYADIVADALQNARNDSEKYALIAKANEVAQERAQDYMLKRLGVPETSAIEAKYGDVSDADIATFQALLYLAGQDGGVNQPEVIEALDRMRTQGLSREDASFLFETRYKPKNNPYK